MATHNAILLNWRSTGRPALATTGWLAVDCYLDDIDAAALSLQDACRPSVVAAGVVKGAGGPAVR